jgi:hypothetical protein
MHTQSRRLAIHALAQRIPLPISRFPESNQALALHWSDILGVGATGLRRCVCGRQRRRCTMEWAQEEVGAADLGDQRLNRRLVRLVERLAEQPSGSSGKTGGIES